MQDLHIGCRSLTQPLFPFFDPTDGATNGKSKVFIGPFWVLMQQAAQGRPLTNQLTFLHVICPWEKHKPSCFFNGRTNREEKATEDQTTSTTEVIILFSCKNNRKIYYQYSTN